MKEILKKVLNEHNINFTAKQINDFELFYRLLVETNNKFNLTRITSKEDFVYKHILDSLSALNLIKSNQKVVDVGAGGGFPSIPLKIMRPDLNITMIDCVEKKINFLNEVIFKLQLTNIAAKHIRAEDLAKEKREAFDVCVTRALAPLNTLLELCVPLIKIGGRIIAYKGSKANDEISAAENASKILGVVLQEKILYNIGKQTNVLLCYDKKWRTPNQYPRRNNKPRKDPI